MRQDRGNPTDVAGQRPLGTRGRLGQAFSDATGQERGSALRRRARERPCGWAPPPARGEGRRRQQVPARLLQAAQASPTKMFKVIVQGRSTTGSSAVASTCGRPALPFAASFKVIAGVAATLTGAQIVRLAERCRDIAAITPDVQVPVDRLPGQRDVAGYRRRPVVWDDVRPLGAHGSGDRDRRLRHRRLEDRRLRRPDRREREPDLAPNNSPGDGRGHGTFVAGHRGGRIVRLPGVGPDRADSSRLDVMDDNGMAMTSDVIAAADWILAATRTQYNIRVANFSLHSAASPASFTSTRSTRRSSSSGSTASSSSPLPATTARRRPERRRRTPPATIRS